MVLNGSHALCKTLQLRETIKYALENSPTLNSTTRELEINGLEVENAFSTFLPSVDFNSTQGVQDTKPSTSTTSPWVSQLSLGFTETLYDNGASLTKYNISTIKKERLKISFDNERDKLCLRVASEFFRYSLATKLNDVQKRQYGLLKKQYDSIATQYRQGYKTRKDFLRFETQLRRSNIDLVNTKNAIKKSEQELFKLIGIPLNGSKEDPFKFSPDLSVKVALPDYQKLQPSIENHYEYKIADLQKKENELTVDLTQRKYWPELNFSTGVSYDNSSYLGGISSFPTTNSVKWNALVTLKYNLWDWGTRRRDTQIAEQSRRIQENALTLKLLDVRSDINKLLLDLKNMEENFNLSQELFELEKKNFSILELEYRSGKIPYLDLITALNDLSNAEAKYFTALYDLKEGVYRYWYHKGRLYEEIL